MENINPIMEAKCPTKPMGEVCRPLFSVPPQSLGPVLAVGRAAASDLLPFLVHQDWMEAYQNRESSI